MKRKYFSKENFEFVSVALKTRKGKMLVWATVASLAAIYITQMIYGSNSMIVMIPCIAMIFTAQGFANECMEVQRIIDMENKKETKKEESIGEGENAV